MPPDVQELFDWLVDGAPGATNPVAVLERFCPDLVTAGIPVERIAAFVQTLHPHIMGRAFRWKPGAPIQVNEASHAILRTPAFENSPVGRVLANAQPFRCRIALEGPGELSVIQELAEQGMTDYVVLPMRFMNGSTHAITFATASPDGFSDDHIDALVQVCRPLSRVAEILALSRTAVNLLDTYVGRNAGDRILKGHILRGDTELIRCVIWFSDLRGFTSMADRTEPGAMIRTLNELFECQVPFIQKHGGEVLKFIGDGLLAIFPIFGEDPKPACQAALTAADEAFAALAQLNEARAARGEPALQFGLAQHVGDVTYGNIGGANRLDFTCIGPAINLAARIEALASKLGKRQLLSAELAAHAARPVVSLGEHELKGVSAKQTVYEPG
ncbi:MAG: adenylate/guanylate cyclase domain-containing protein [Polyangiaceae bacterium]|nr:adenylate/guanylate cyclase domain-containing protein [Polyangiaceae bacterium]MBK9001525.1 adenylate/guanylate cyclase domain-containing protein [Myxococcales bacterium]MCE7888550.1 adenylate/guanylate cyclase domain-containing protein [Sorangiineae bacterium PRO1]MCL4753321.1 adenylate/guanylate cyclase domain-containing protein [Myxococcales bacterium]MCL4756594.1 adenylate/guanylate cyclase domain-containing protein [Myxococcales bacterium]